MRTTIRGLDVIVTGLESFGPAVREAAFVGVMRGVKIAKSACEQMLSADDHSLKELADMDHPYSKRHPQIIHEPDEVVHERSGDLKRGLRAVPPVGLPYAVIQGKVVNDDPKDRWIQEGTVTMRPRPYMERVTQEYGQDIGDVVQATIDAAIQSESGAA